MTTPTSATACTAIAILSLVACSSRVAGPHDRCDPAESPQTLALSASMCAGAGAPAASASPDSPPPPPSGSADAGAAAAPPPSPPADSPLLDPATCEIDCSKACGGVPDATCKRLSEKEVECRIARPGHPGC